MKKLHGPIVRSVGKWIVSWATAFGLLVSTPAIHADAVKHLASRAEVLGPRVRPRVQSQCQMTGYWGLGADVPKPQITALFISLRHNEELHIVRHGAGLAPSGRYSANVGSALLRYNSLRDQRDECRSIDISATWGQKSRMQESEAAEPSSYRAYTTKFDQVVTVDQLDSAIGTLGMRGRAQVDAAWDELQSGLLPWRTKLQVDCEKLGRTIKSALSEEERNETVVTLLWDHSGSMRGQKMLYSAATADVAQEFLTTLGIACEILGFTTSEWQGGRSRKRWTWRFRPHNPGRLNDLLHVIFRDASDNRVSTGSWSYRQMLRPDYPKENVDGEAIEWATQRLRSIPEQRKILIVLSDGAPVDDSTLIENGPTYLSDHLQEVVERLTDENEIEIASFGVGFKPHSFYAVSRHVDDPADLGSGLLEFLRDLLINQLDA